MNPQALLQNKAVLFGIIGIFVLIIGLVIFMTMAGGGESDQVKKEEIIKKPFKLIETPNAGQAMEIQAHLARIGITNVVKSGETKVILHLEKYTKSERDRAIIGIVQSGLMDKNIGLEIFDKGDFTSTREDKRIRLARAINGELSRLIKKIKPIEDATVFVSIPKNAFFRSEKKPRSATVQLVMPPPGDEKDSDKLPRDKVRAIKNLLIGSIEGLKAEHISITDTNGNVYNSILDHSGDRMELLRENDRYMKNKVMMQLNKLLGKGNYVVTVSTYLREVPLEKNRVVYNPKDSAIANKQQFTEGLGDQSQDKNRLSSAVSSYLPGGLPMAPDSSQKRNYTRSALEYKYGVGKTQFAESFMPGMLEEISIAVTIHKSSFPSNISMREMKELIAMSASPKAKAENVEIVLANIAPPILASERGNQLPEPETSGNPWWTVAILLGAGLFIGLFVIAGRAKRIAAQHQREIDQLVQQSQHQNNKLQEANDRAAKLQEMQNQLKQQVEAAPKQQQALPQFNNTISEIKKTIETSNNQNEVALQLKNWIESK